MASPAPVVIGWKERIRFPDWRVGRVRVKIDTGARTSALGADFYTLIDDTTLGRIVEMSVVFDRRRPDQAAMIRVPFLGFAMVMNSGGMTEQRPLIETRIRLGPILKTIRLTVTNRCRMRFPVILGRTALAGDFLVDVQQSFTQKKIL